MSGRVVILFVDMFSRYFKGTENILNILLL